MHGLGLLDVSVRSDEADIAVHLVNLHSPDAAAGEYVTELAPLPDQIVRLRLDAAADQQRVTVRLLRRNAVPEWSWTGERELEVVVPSVEDFEVVAVTIAGRDGRTR